MVADCHIHMVLDGKNWKKAIARHADRPDEGAVRETLQSYRAAGFSYLRDGGDRWGAGLLAKQLAPAYGITYRCPGAPLYRKGHYGAFIGLGFETAGEFGALLEKNLRNGADFCKIMVSGLMDFDRYGRLTEPGMEPGLLQELVSIAHDMGVPVMVHCNGAQTMKAAAQAQVDSIEHGAYGDEDTLRAMVDAGVIWVPTLSAVGNLRGTGRFDEGAVAAILRSAQENVARFAALGGLVAPGSDAGAWAVPHGTLSEYTLLEQVVSRETVERGLQALMERF